MRIRTKQPLIIAAVVCLSVAIGLSGLLFSQAAEPNSGDINHDGTISLVDAQLLIEKFESLDRTADLNQDGAVDILDLSILLANLTEPTPTKPSKMLGLNASSDPNATDSQVAARLGADFRRADIRDINMTLTAGAQPVLAILYPSWDAAGVEQVKNFVNRNHQQLVGISIGNESGYGHNTSTYAQGAQYAAFWRQLMAAKPTLPTAAQNVPFIMDFDSGGRGDSAQAARWAKQIVDAGFPNPDMIELHAYGPNYMNKINDDLALLPTSWQGKVAITEFGVQVRYINGVAYQPGKTYGDTPQPMTPERGAQLLTERVQTMLSVERISMINIYSAYDTAPANEGEDHFWGMAYHNGQDKPFMADAFRNLKRSIK